MYLTTARLLYEDLDLLEHEPNMI